MGQVIFIMWRECVEALLVIGILYAWLKRTPDAAGGKRWLWGGVATGLVMAGALAAGIYVAEGFFVEHQDAFQLGMVLIAAALIVQMVYWMRRHGRTLKKDLEQGLSRQAETSNWWGVLILAAMAVAREGSEAVVFLFGTLSAAPADTLPWMGLAALAGLALALATFALLQVGSRILDWRLFFRITEVMLLLLGAALLTTGIEKMQMLEWLPALREGLWNSAWLLDDMSRFGGVVASLTGYRAQPSLMTILAYIAYWVLVLGLLRRGSPKPATAAIRHGQA